MRKILPIAIFFIFIIGCNHDWKPDYIAYANVKEIRMSGLTDKPGLKLTIGYWETNNYKTKQMFKSYTTDTTDHFSPGIDITYFTVGGHNPPIYSWTYTFNDNILTLNFTYFNED